MAEDMLTKAIAQKKQLVEEMKKLDAFISMYRRLQAGEAQIVGYPPIVTVTPDPRKSVETESSIILREAGEALPTKEILQRLSDRNIHVGGKDPVNNLASVLSRSEAIQNIRGKGWKLGHAQITSVSAGSNISADTPVASTQEDAPPAETDGAP